MCSERLRDFVASFRKRTVAPTIWTSGELSNSTLDGVTLEGSDISKTIFPVGGQGEVAKRDRKSTRLNSSHSQISYAVFCLKKKKNKKKKKKNIIQNKKKMTSIQSLIL